nr:flavin reductase family protein [Nocardioides sp. MAH-18]
MGGPVSLVTTGAAADRAGLTVSSLMVANGSPARVLLLVDPDSDLADAVASSGTAVVQLLSWGDRDLAEAFAGTAPAPGGPWRLGTFEDTEWGPRLSSAATWAGVRVESTSTAGWSSLLTCVVESIEVGADDEPLISRRGRWVRP